MTIGILAPFSPSSIREYFPKQDISHVVTYEAATAVNNLVKGLLQMHCSVVIFSLDPTSFENRSFIGEGVTIHLIGNKTRLPFFKNVPNLRKNTKKIRHSLDKHVHSLDVLHAHWAYEYANACIPYAKSKVVICTYRDWAKTIVDNIPKRPLFPYIVKRLIWCQKSTMSKAVIREESIHLIANSEYMYQNIQKLARDKTRVDVICNSVLDESILTEPRCDVDTAVFVCISASLDNHLKNVLSLVKAFRIVRSNYSDAKLYLIGPYHKDRELYQYVLDNEMEDDVLFMGTLSHEEVLSVIDNSFCLVHPSIEESFGNTLIEAMSRCKPIIGGIKSGAVPFVLNNGECGCLCDVEDFSCIARAMIRVIEDQAYRQHIVEAGTTRLKKNYSNSIIVRKHIQLYRRLIDENNSHL